MAEMGSYRMPMTGEAWRHYKGALYTVVGISINDDGTLHVIYVPFGWSLQQLPSLFNQPLGRFLQEVKHDVPRFSFEREDGCDPTCPFIRERSDG